MNGRSERSDRWKHEQRIDGRAILPTIALFLVLAAGSHTSLSAQVWTSRGPAAAINGQVEGITNRPVSGAVEAVVAHPTNPDILWIGAVNGGVFRTDNATVASPTWVPQTDSQGSLSIGALELDPTDATNATLVAGIGRTSSFGSSGGPHTGVLRTTDGGATWTPFGNGITGIEVSGVAPRGAIIVVAAEDADSGFFATGIYRSVDTGASFVQVTGGVGTGLPIGRAFDMAGDPTDPTRLFTIIRDTGTPGSSGIYRSDDTGATWTQISDATQEALLNAPATDANLAVGTAGPSSPNVFAAICTSGRLAGLQRTGDASIAAPTWIGLDLPQTTEAGGVTGIHPGGQCSTHLSLVADPNDDDVVFVGGDRQPSGFPTALGAFNFSGRLFRVDAGLAGGSQATSITHCSSAAPAGCGGSQRTASNSSPHADSREMVFDANGDIIEVDDGGVYRHTDPNGTTGDWVSVIGNLAVTEQHDSALDRVAGIALSGNQDTGTTQQMAAGLTWDSLSTADGGDVAVAENDPVVGQSTRYSSFQNLGSLRRRVFDASNVLQSTQAPSLTPLAGSPAVSAQFVTPLAVNGVTPTRMILGADNGTYESADRLDSVTRISTAVVNSFGRGPIGYGVTGNADILYFGSGDDIFTRTGPPGSSLSASDPDAGSSGFIAGLVVDPGNANAAFAVDSDQVFRTTNTAGSWTDVTGNLQTLSPGTLRSVEFVPDSLGDRLVVGADAGVFVATEGSGFATWADLGVALPNAPVFDLDYDSGADALVAGTLGRGAWTLDSVVNCPVNLVLASLTITGTPTLQATASVTLGPGLLANGLSVVVNAPTVAFGNGTQIGGTFSAGNTTTCP